MARTTADINWSITTITSLGTNVTTLKANIASVILDGRNDINRALQSYFLNQS